MQGMVMQGSITGLAVGDFVRGGPAASPASWPVCIVPAMGLHFRTLVHMAIDHCRMNVTL
ncbi:hypothetical protein EV681_1493 [Advenella incenata]|jgi:acyl carrier protein phosphodiesterase|uniref:Uncharacterized protein n=1 Tax=Advenella incenata TaxID=267800 RepID=A0A4Q7VT10_9BURK|nr:hypothetical protein EV681_1493 [Advenella incenata]